MSSAKLLWAHVVTCCLVACGSVAHETATDAGHVDAHGSTSADAGGPRHRDGGSVTPPEMFIDAGYYRGDGSFFVDGGAYRDVSTSLDASTHPFTDSAMDAPTDAPAGCASLLTCCATLPSAAQALCNSVASGGDAANCAAEMAQLESGGECAGVAVLATQLQVTPRWMVSDGTYLFWTTETTPLLLAMPVGGGAVTTLLTDDGNGAFPAPLFLAVDDVNLYMQYNGSLLRIPKDGSAASLVSEPGAYVFDATTLAGIAYWTESVGGPPNALTGYVLGVRSAPLQGGSVASLLQSDASLPNSIAVTGSTAFIGSNPMKSLPLSGMPSGGLHNVALGQSSCEVGTSDVDAIYCAQQSGMNFRVASNGTVTPLGPSVNSSYIAFDDSSVYWVDQTTVGSIMKAPKAGGGTATVLAHDTSPVAIAVDAHAVYWSDEGGYIKSVAK